mmetsp:Transcript_24385/g.68383  ORF Transcript_24385/g.68383 Transcript_24385/m.68383 type:complete len:206 (-) Transcript_24385:110-727(-)|eukprot:CAMPEP_0119127134 /NCGR_PEP_ID=MMETSP1310-20130426/5793_1 /TAXON_ID=464262 /ORGANISM="Genus nov. species nov., Strain RCC2339" /LENGTH=205 /DNA_ID=CAMNT_0007117359 /DNA_START=154 /DNA_END=771 /DNA_ORIENTATION=-
MAGEEVGKVVEELVGKGDFEELVKVCDRHELSRAMEGKAPDHHLLPIHLAAHLIVGDVQGARYLWLRTTPKGKAASPAAGKVWEVGASLYSHDSGSALRKLRSFDAPPPLQGMMQHLCVVEEARALDLLSRSYSLIAASSLANSLGLPVPQAVSLATSFGFVVSGDSLHLSPPPPPPPTSVPSEPLDPRLLQKLTEYVSFLESSV